MNLQINSKNFLITGSSRGIGKSIAQAFLDEGANVGLVARNQSELKETSESLYISSESKISHWNADLTNQKEVQNLLDNVCNEWGVVDGIVLNVGNGRSKSEPITTADQWESVWNTNFNSALFTARAFLPELFKSKGCIVFISSICGIEALGAPTDYSVAKTALISLSKNLARKVGPDVRVNLVAPGNIFFEGGTWDQKINDDNEKVKNMLSEQVPLKRFGKPEEIADAVVFLCSKRSAFTTGACLVVDGGQTKSF